MIITQPSVNELQYFRPDQLLDWWMQVVIPAVAEYKQPHLVLAVNVMVFAIKAIERLRQSYLLKARRWRIERTAYFPAPNLSTDLLERRAHA